MKAGDVSTNWIAKRGTETSNSEPTGLETGNRVSALDGWRGMSILLVLIGHFFPSTLRFLNFGTFGVECFFVLSGRLMAEILFVRSGPLSEFYLRRLSRVLPALWIFVILSWIVWSHSQFRISPADVGEALTFTYNYSASIGRHHAEIIDHIWSLCIEEHTYLLLGVGALLTRRFGLTPVSMLTVLGCASALDMTVSDLLGRHHFAEFWRTDCHLFSIVFGSLIYLCVRRGMLSEQLYRYIPPITLAAAAALSASHLPQAFVSIGTALFLSSSVSLIEYAPSFIRRVFNNRYLGSLGSMSFSVYLWQQPFAKMAMTYSSHIVRPLLLVLALAVAVVSFYTVERPSRRWLNKVIASTSSRRQAVRLDSYVRENNFLKGS